MVPGEETLSNSLQMIFGEEPDLLVVNPDALVPSHVASYVDSESNVVACCLCDIAAASSLACALSLIPIPISKEMISQKTLTEIANDNLYEVMNIFSSLFMNDTTDHLRLRSVNPDVVAGAAHFEGMESIAFQIAGTKYPGGQIAFRART